jgi:hypothetical protein
MNLARPFKAGRSSQDRTRRVATLERSGIQPSLRDEIRDDDLIPALKRRAKFNPTLRVEETVQSFLESISVISVAKEKAGLTGSGRRLISSIRRYRARFCNDRAYFKLSHYWVASYDLVDRSLINHAKT